MRRPRARGGSPEPADRGTAPGPGNAFDELRFGRERILNLREILPTPEVATARAESWLREQQVAGAREVLVITGRGNSSPGGVSPVREAVLRLCTRLRHAGVLDSISEHNPGAFVITIAPMSRLFRSPRSRRHPTPPTPLEPGAIAGLSAASVAALRDLARRSLDQDGIREPTASMITSEMERRFSLLVSALGDEPGREHRLHAAIRATIRELEDQ